MANEICYLCHNSSIQGCNWFRNFTPVDGWDATKVTSKQVNGWVETWQINDCPEFIPNLPYGKDFHIIREGYERMLVNFAQRCVLEYKSAKEDYDKAIREGDTFAIDAAEFRWKSIREYMEGLEPRLEKPVELPTMAKEDLYQLYVDEVLNDPNKANQNTKVRLSNSARKASIVAKLLPCTECIYQNHKECTCNFEHSGWRPKKR